MLKRRAWATMIRRRKLVLLKRSSDYLKPNSSSSYVGADGLSISIVSLTINTIVKLHLRTPQTYLDPFSGLQNNFRLQIPVLKFPISSLAIHKIFYPFITLKHSSDSVSRFCQRKWLTDAHSGPTIERKVAPRSRGLLVPSIGIKFQRVGEIVRSPVHC